MSKGLTDRQRMVLYFIQDTIKAKGYQPSYKEIMVNMGTTSHKGVADHITALQKKGFVEREPHRRRALILKKRLNKKHTPVLMEYYI
jgi:repressor LexA